MVKVYVNNNEYQVDLSQNGFYINDKLVDTDIENIRKNEYHVLVNGWSVSVNIVNLDYQNSHITLEIEGYLFECQISSKREEIIEHVQLNDQLKNVTNKMISPMPGLIQKILVKKGDKIRKDTPLIILNAMKMENIIKASQDGVVEEIYVKEEEQVEKGKVLIQF